MALGADGDQLLRSFLKQGVFLLCVGLSLGGPAPVPPESPSIQFERYLGNLDRNEKESILAALHEFERLYSSAPSEIQADAFRLFRAFYAESVRDQDRRFYRRQNLQKVLHLAADQVDSHTNPLASLEQSDTFPVSPFKKEYRRELEELNEYRNCGMRFTYGEGDWYLEEDPDFLITAARSLNGEYRDYLVFHCHESRQKLTADAGLLASWDELGRKISRWEQFARRHSGLPEVQTTIEPEIRRMVSWYLTGTDNTPAYDFRNEGKIDPKLYQSHETFVQQNPHSRYADLLRKSCESLSASAMRINPEVLDLLIQSGYSNPYIAREAGKLFDKTNR